jgi:molybdate transport system substrate-binding protein
MRGLRKIAAIAVAGLCFAIASTAASAAEVVLVTTAAVEQIMRGLIPSFERTTGNTVKMSVYGTGLAVERVKNGTDVPDVVLLGPPALDELAHAGKVDAKTITPAFRSRIGFAVRAGAPKPDISTDEAFRQALLAAKSIGYSIGPSGEHFSKSVIQQLGIADQIKSKMKNVRGMPVGAGVAKGEVEVGVHQIAELMPIKGIDIVGALPADLQTTIIYATAIAPDTKTGDAARALVKFITAPDAAPVVRKNGMDPA